MHGFWFLASSAALPSEEDRASVLIWEGEVGILFVHAVVVSCNWVEIDLRLDKIFHHSKDLENALLQGFKSPFQLIAIYIVCNPIVL